MKYKVWFVLFMAGLCSAIGECIFSFFCVSQTFQSYLPNVLPLCEHHVHCIDFPFHAFGVDLVI